MASDALRVRAREIHRSLRHAGCSLEELPLPVAADLLGLALAETGIDAYALPADDPLLGGAHAALDRDACCIWWAEPVESSHVRRGHFAMAHELAHFWLHPLCPDDRIEVDEESLADLISGGDMSVVTALAAGYSPQERREREANLFAAEFLLPAPIALRAFAAHRMPASVIAARTGLSVSLVMAQLSYALSLPLAGAPDKLPAAENADAPLDESQRRAAEIPEGPALVEAGPGTGKTRTLIARAVHLLEKRGVAPENLLMLTFSNRAAEEMRTRLRAAVGMRADRAWIGTFHALGMEMLRKDGARIGIPSGARLIETTDAVALLERNIDRLKLSAYEYLSDPSLPFADILRCISRAKDELVDPEGYRAAAHGMACEAAETKSEALREAADRAAEVARVYAVYDELMRAGGLLDFGDLIRRSIELLDACPDLRERWTRQYPFILADEYQDVNRASAQFVARLTGAGKGFWVVGDVRQSIYRFRGASPANVTRFEEDYPGGARVRLDVNYRSRVPIVDLVSRFAGAMLAADGGVGGSSWSAPRGDAGSVQLALADDEEAQADGIAASILERCAAGVALNHQAVLCATNSQCTSLARMLEARGIPVRLAGGLLERREIKELLALLSFAAEPSGSALALVANMAEYGIPDSDIRALWNAADAAKSRFPAALSLASEIPEITDVGRAGLARLRDHTLDVRGDVWTFLCRYLFEVSDCLRPLLDEDSSHSRQARLAIHYLLSFVHAQSIRLRATEGRASLRDFLDRFRRMLQCGDARIGGGGADPEEMDAVPILTVHQSKGLEFPVVYLPNLNHNQFPVRAQGRMAEPPPAIEGITGGPRSAEDADECLFFVALSRAEDTLVLSRPLIRNGKPTQPSRMLAALEEHTELCRVEWKRQAHSGDIGGQSRDDAPSKSVQQAKHAEYPVSVLDQYQECPRRFYYQYIADLPRLEEKGSYQRFHDALNDAMHWMRESRHAGRDPSEAEVLEVFDARIALIASPPQAAAHDRILRARAVDMLQAARGVDTAGRPFDARFVAELPNGRVRITADEALGRENGEVLLVKYMRRGPKQGDQTDERLALLRHAARQRVGDAKLEIRMRYLNGGTEELARESARYEPARVEKYNRALGAIACEEFPAKPEPRRCARCPFLFVCPE